MSMVGRLNPWRTSESQNISVVLHAAGYLVFLSAVFGLNSAARAPDFALMAALAGAMGHAVSLLLRRIGRAMRLVELISVAVCLVIAAKMMLTDHAELWFLPTVTAADPELRLASLLLMIEVLRSFTLMNDDAVIFTAVPAATLLSLAANANINPDMLAYFLMYLTCTCFLLVHRSALASGCQNRVRYLPEQLRSATAIALSAVIAGALLSVPLKLMAAKTLSAFMPDLIRANTRVTRQLGMEPGTMRIAQGPIDLSDEMVMLVKVQMDGHGALMRDWYWRGRVYDEYTGHGWRNTFRSRGSPKPPSDDSNPSDQEISPFRSTVRVKQTVHIFGIPDGMLYAAPEPVGSSVKEISAESEENKNTGATRTYSVESISPNPTHEQLEQAGTNYPPQISTRYLQTVVGTIRTSELAHKVAGDLDTPYAQAKAIEAYLSSNYIYDTNAAPAPRTVDAVEYFMFSARSGYCDVFASAMVVMCRELGIPSRLATGFASGVYDPDLGAFRVRDADRHAWVEVYFPDYGWISFDPVAPMGQPRQGLARELQQSLRNLWRAMVSNPITPVVLLVLLTALLFSTAGIMHLSDAVSKIFVRKSSCAEPVDPLRAATAKYYTTMCLELKKAGMPPRGNLAPGEYRDLLLTYVDADSDAAEKIRDFTSEFERVRYGGRTPRRLSGKWIRSQRRAIRNTLGESR